MHPHTSTSDQPTTGPSSSDAASPQPEEPIAFRGPDDLVVAVPHLVGFVPERSLVVVSVRRRGTRLGLGVVARFDLPPAGRGRAQGREGTAAHVSAFVRQVVDTLVKDAPEQVALLVYDATPCSLVPVWQRLVSRLRLAFAAVDVAVLDALHVSGTRFRAYRCSDPSCCPPQGRPVDAGASAVTAEFVARAAPRCPVARPWRPWSSRMTSRPAPPSGARRVASSWRSGRAGATTSSRPGSTGRSRPCGGCTRWCCATCRGSLAWTTTRPAGCSPG